MDDTDDIPYKRIQLDFYLKIDQVQELTSKILR